MVSILISMVNDAVSRIFLILTLFGFDTPFKDCFVMIFQGFQLEFMDFIVQ